ncbi:MAG: prepilin peptidase [Deltaproteobacteria bacterium HGW-Deltaproteobacteria-19]|jgi:preprotein translocase subunit SecA|nr:MAG: prepilin peptidase [Deltaproteobacteria bacterium HGW-Deltaproteobacteria-19]
MGRDIRDWPVADYFHRPERRERRRTFLDRTAWDLAGIFIGPGRARFAGLKGIVEQVGRHEPAIRNRTDGELRDRTRSLKPQLRREGFRDDLVAEAFALIREVDSRILGMRPFDCQLVGGFALLKGFLAEMDTGEGKTLVATLPAATVAMAGLPVHVITVNDYLTARDAELMGEVYRFLGLSVDCVIHDKTPAQRRRAYGCDIVYCTNKEVVFDYLRDRIALGDRVDPYRLHAEHLYDGKGKNSRLLLRGLHYAIVDEADSVLVDEARTPLIISRTETSEAMQTTLRQALDMAGNMEEERDYRINYEADDGMRTISMTEAARESINRAADSMGTLWRSSVRREELVMKALTALHLYRRDEQYLVRDGKVQIIDEFTGRVMPDRSWEGGLHQLIEAKEGCEITGQRETVARISYQRFFRRYLKISGMSGTAKEVRRELWSVYGLPFVRIPTNRPARRRLEPDRIYASQELKWRSVAGRIVELHAGQHPVLVGTRTVAASEHLSRLLTEAGLPHQVLNAKQDKEEARIIAQAGEPGRITIATNMAGRGTDIILAPGVAERGGLYVIMTERHEAGRIDRQLAGRCGRQGDPGTCEAFLSLEDPLISEGARGMIGRLGGWLRKHGYGIGDPVGKLAIRRAQKRVEKAHAGVRKRLLKYDEERGDTLSFSGKTE